MACCTDGCSCLRPLDIHCSNMYGKLLVCMQAHEQHFPRSKAFGKSDSSANDINMTAQFNNSRHEYEIFLENQSVIEVCQDDEDAASIPKMLYHVRLPPEPCAFNAQHCLVLGEYTEPLVAAAEEGCSAVRMLHACVSLLFHVGQAQRNEALEVNHSSWRTATNMSCCGLVQAWSGIKALSGHKVILFCRPYAECCPCIFGSALNRPCRQDYV